MDTPVPLPSGSPVPSPCVLVCRIDPLTRLCEGCLRTLGEIADWATMTEADKLAVWQRLEQRRERLARRAP